MGLNLPAARADTGKMARARAHLARLHDDESGFTIIEVLVSALVVVLVSLGVLKTLDAASSRSGEQKAQSVVAALAQQDQERLRAISPANLSNYTETRCVQQRPNGGFRKDPECNNDPALGPLYKIVSRTDWVSDKSGTRACGTSARADYIRISSTAIWIDSNTEERGDANSVVSRNRRVTLTSVVAPRAGSFGDEGSLSIEIQDRNGTGRPGVNVDVTGPKALSGTTDNGGCLFFGYLNQGDYTVSVSQPGLVDANGNGDVESEFGVRDGSTTSAVVQLDQAARLDVRFQTRKGTSTIDSEADNVSIGQTGLASPGWRLYGNGTPRPSYALGSSAFPPPLFPFTSAYSVYSGNCPGARPSFYNGVTWTAFATLPPGGSASVTAFEPAVRLNPSGSGWPDGNPNQSGTQASIPADAWVFLKPEVTWPVSGGAPTFCSTTKEYRTRKDNSTDPHAWLANVDDPADFGLPAGAYDVCVVYPTSPASSRRYRWLSDSEANGTPADNGVRPLDNGPTASNAALNVPLPNVNPNPDSAYCP
jgi:type II secretory pathway pseudopilin PulG